MLPVVRIVLGLFVLLWGRRLYWIMVGVGGLLAGWEFALQTLAASAPWVQFVVAAGAAVVGVLLALLAQRVAFAVLGFYGGGLLALAVTHTTGGGSAATAWFVVGGVVGAVIAALVMDWAIIVVTSLAGGAAIALSLAANPIPQVILFVILAGIGIAYQARGLERASTPPAPPAPPESRESPESPEPPEPPSSQERQP